MLVKFLLLVNISTFINLILLSFNKALEDSKTLKSWPSTSIFKRSIFLFHFHYNIDLM